MTSWSHVMMHRELQIWNKTYYSVFKQKTLDICDSSWTLRWQDPKKIYSYLKGNICSTYYPWVGLLGCKVIDTPMETNVKLLPEWEDLDNPGGYRRLVGKSNLTVTRQNIAFTISVVSAPKTSHWNATIQIFMYLWKLDAEDCCIEIDRRPTRSYYVFVGRILRLRQVGNIV